MNIDVKRLDNFSLQYMGLKYFGSMTASIAHEIKNALAITNENAGLMEDLSFISMKNEQPLDTEKIARLSGKIVEQIKRADNIVKKMSRFSHSVDDPIKVVNLTEIVELMVELGRRSAFSYGVTLETFFDNSMISIETNPFLLMNLLWLITKSACERVDNSKKLDISISKADKNIYITLKNLIALEKSNDNLDSLQKEYDENTAGLAQILNADIDMQSKNKIIITIKNN